MVGDYGEAAYRAKLLAKYLERAGRSVVPVGIGLDIAPFGDGRQAAWVRIMISNPIRAASSPTACRPLLIP